MENDTNMSDLDINLEVLNSIITSLKKLDTDGQKKILQAVTTLLGISWPISHSYGNVNFPTAEFADSSQKSISFLENRSMSPKEFLRDKAPQTDIERIACLAYYLTHYRDTPHFKTIDLSALNTEAAQPKLSNAAFAVENASKRGLLVQAGAGKKQISASGELYVQALPDREAAKSSVANISPKRRSKKQVQKRSNKA